MSKGKNTSNIIPSISLPLRMSRYATSYIERYFKYVWKQTGWIWTQGVRYISWMKRQSFHNGFKIILSLVLIFFVGLWIGSLFFGFLKAL